VDTSTHHLSAFGHHVTIGTGFPIYEGGEEGLLPSVNILRFHRSTLASTIQTTFTKVSTDLIPAAPLWLRDIIIIWYVTLLLLRPLVCEGGCCICKPARLVLACEQVFNINILYIV
jgi:hypothetical protein